MQCSDENFAQGNKFCPYPWLSLSIEPDESFRVCCYGDENRQIKTSDKITLLATKVTGVNDVFNSENLKSIRKEMLNNCWPDLCVACRDAEQLGQISKRQEALKTYKQLIPKLLNQTTPDGTCLSSFINHLDISLGNHCNYKCRMCSPYFSHLLIKDYKKCSFIFDEKRAVRANNFFKNFPHVFLQEIWQSCKTIDIQGGEPFCSPVHDQFINSIIESGYSKEIELHYITNLGHSKFQMHHQWKYFKKISFTISIDGTEEIYEYIRQNGQWSKFVENINLLVFTKKQNEIIGDINFNTLIQAYNLANITSILKFLANNYSGSANIMPDFSILTRPTILQTKVLPDDFRKFHVENIISMLDFNKNLYKEIDIVSVKKMLSKIKQQEQCREHLLSFLVFNKKLDLLWKTNLQSIFPKGFSV